MSITHLYIVLFPHTPLQWICKVQLVLLTLAWLSSLLPTFFMCEPLEYIWNRNIEGGKCINVKAFWRGTGAIALFFDVTCVVLPLPVLWSLKMGVWQKLKLTMLFGLGLGICIITALRIYYDELMDFADLSYTAAPVIMCAVPEPSFAIVLGSIPIMLPLFTRASNTVKSGFANNKPTFTPSPGQSRPPTAQTQDLPHRPAPLQRSDSKKFKQWVDHVYPLTPITEGGRGSDESGRAGYSVDLERGSRRIPSWGGITIRKEVRINSEKNHVHDAKLEAEKEKKKRRRSSFKRGHLESDSVQERPEPCCPRENEI
ncbi:hypothetical protein BS50DRAFT_572401 [Corynespora cassiicola Philippines]|uniref:Rhodopsin domain-containing protein n=1 Tax=Corynespora cassiicola Philippines TaxID=1448308 RepID=A0A2T2NUY3_CORCC|nr:hypothetical protein BS50DRAFT_572401 [Corynespora cassiicola Philippines]